MEDFLNKENEVVQGELLYQGYSLEEAIEKFKHYQCKYNVGGSRNYASNIAYKFDMSTKFDKFFNLSAKRTRKSLSNLPNRQAFPLLICS